MTDLYAPDCSSCQQQQMVDCAIEKLARHWNSSQLLCNLQSAIARDLHDMDFFAVRKRPSCVSHYQDRTSTAHETALPVLRQTTYGPSTRYKLGARQLALLGRDSACAQSSGSGGRICSCRATTASCTAVHIADESPACSLYSRSAVDSSSPILSSLDRNHDINRLRCLRPPVLASRATLEDHYLMLNSVGNSLACSSATGAFLGLFFVDVAKRPILHSILRVSMPNAMSRLFRVRRSSFIRTHDSDSPATTDTPILAVLLSQNVPLALGLSIFPFHSSRPRSCSHPRPGCQGRHDRGSGFVRLVCGESRVSAATGLPLTVCLSSLRLRTLRGRHASKVNSARA